MQQQQATTTIGVKATFVPTDEHRFLALPTPPSFGVLVDKIASLFAIGSEESSGLRVHYIDDESDRVAMSSTDELTCALSLVPSGRQLRLFVTLSALPTAPSVPQSQEDEQQVKKEPKAEEQDCAFPAADVSPSNIVVEGAVQATVDEATDQEPAAIDVLKAQLRTAGVEIGTEASLIDEKRCQRVLARFEGDVAKAAQAIERMHARKQKQQAVKPDSGNQEAKQAEREARKSARLAARLARQEERNQRRSNKQTRLTDDAANEINADPIQKKTHVPVDAAAIDGLMAFIASHQIDGEPIAPLGRGKCMAAYRKADGDVEAAKANLLAWTAKRHQRQKKQCKTAVDLNMEKLLGLLEDLGFGAPAITTDADNNANEGKARKASERIQKRNERLIKRFGGELDQVVGFLATRQAKIDARAAMRKASGTQYEKPRCARRNQDQKHPLEQAATAL